MVLGLMGCRFADPGSGEMCHLLLIHIRGRRVVHQPMVGVIAQRHRTMYGHLASQSWKSSASRYKAPVDGSGTRWSSLTTSPGRGSTSMSGSGKCEEARALAPQPQLDPGVHQRHPWFG